MTWTVIKTAPKDGTYVLLSLEGTFSTALNWTKRSVFTAYFNAQANDWLVEGHNWLSQTGASPLGWQPLPDPPEAA